MKIEKDEITIRDFAEIDLPLMFKWLTDEQYKSMHIRKIDGICITIHHLFFDFVK